jgi:beta-lactamase regulating signal transducer with metallopeptidase domain
MMLSWMVYALLVTLLLAFAAWALEEVVRQRGWPVRGVWVLALLGSFATPLVAGLLPPRRSASAPAPPPVGEAAPATVSEPRPEWTQWTTAPLAAVPAPAQDSRLDRWLGALWGAASAGLALSLAISYLALARRRRRWMLREVDGRPVWVSTDTGPAVVGFLRSRIVLPEWVLEGRPASREIVLAHEEEHVRAGDPRLLLGALLVSVALPWNLGVWWMWRSLRRAVEIDCDLRVLARGVDPRAYSRLLVEVTERGTAHRLTVAALSESSSFLERRVRLMLDAHSRGWWPRALAASALAGLAIMAACRMEQPVQPPVPSTGATYAVGEDGALTKLPDTAVAIPAESVAERGQLPLASAPEGGSPRLSDSAELSPVQRMVLLAAERFYPNVLTEKIPGGRVSLYFLADARGEMVKTGFDTEPRSGSCGAALVSGLGTAPDPHQLGWLGCGDLRQLTSLPNRVAVYWATLEPRPGEENAPPTGPFLFGRAASEGRPSEAVLRAAVERYDPDVLRAGLPYGEGLWFVADGDHRVLHSGRWLVKGSSTIARNELEKKLPGTRLGAILMSSVKTTAGESVDLVWATLEEPGARSTRQASAGTEPYAHVRTFAVTTRTPGQEVRILLEGEAARDPSAFRLDGKFSKNGGVIVARTPFTFVVVSPAPFRATLTANPPEEEIQLMTEVEGDRLRMSGSALELRRDRSGEPIRAGVNGSGRTAQVRSGSSTIPRDTIILNDVNAEAELSAPIAALDRRTREALTNLGLRITRAVAGIHAAPFQYEAVGPDRVVRVALEPLTSSRTRVSVSSRRLLPSRGTMLAADTRHARMVVERIQRQD